MHQLALAAKAINEVQRDSATENPAASADAQEAIRHGTLYGVSVRLHSSRGLAAWTFGMDNPAWGWCRVQKPLSY
ncbi:protein of unknown function [Azospirillum baldaniorum]|uniref:Uncharacterized protein n=1 Tax=Azospirillum baldaniorum TaxID=1064539 RepID=A0A9P1NML7_9PROT|nr:protein of unknown function [Azospirillum baldaniorum]